MNKKLIIIPFLILVVLSAYMFRSKLLFIFGGAHGIPMEIQFDDDYDAGIIEWTGDEIVEGASFVQPGSGQAEVSFEIKATRLYGIEPARDEWGNFIYSKSYEDCGPVGYRKGSGDNAHCYVHENSFRHKWQKVNGYIVAKPIFSVDCAKTPTAEKIPIDIESDEKLSGHYRRWGKTYSAPNYAVVVHEMFDSGSAYYENLCENCIKGTEDYSKCIGRKDFLLEKFYLEVSDDGTSKWSGSTTTTTTTTTTIPETTTTMKQPTPPEPPSIWQSIKSIFLSFINKLIFWK